MIKEKIISFEREHRFVPKSVAAVSAVSMALSGVPINASAASGGGSGSSIDISSVTDSMTSSLSDLVSKVAVACAGVVGAGLTIFGLKWVVKTVKSFFSKIAN